MKAEVEYNQSQNAQNSDASSNGMQKDFIEVLFEQYNSENSRFQQFLVSSLSHSNLFRYELLRILTKKNFI